MNKIAFSDRKVPLPAGYEDIRASLRSFAKQHRRYNANVFLMMAFQGSRRNTAVTNAIRLSLQEYGLVGLRADDCDYAETLWGNVCTYLLGCAYGIAVFEKVGRRGFNPNVAIEVGFMLSRKKRLLILKDQRIHRLPTDTVGRLYREFDPGRLRASIHKQVSSWAKTIGLKKVRDMFSYTPKLAESVRKAVEAKKDLSRNERIRLAKKELSRLMKRANVDRAMKPAFVLAVAKAMQRAK